MVKTSAPKLLTGKVPSKASRMASSVVNTVKDKASKVYHSDTGQKIRGALGSGSLGALKGGLYGTASQINYVTPSVAIHTNKEDPRGQFGKALGYGAAGGALVGGLTGGALGYKNKGRFPDKVYWPEETGLDEIVMIPGSSAHGFNSGLGGLAGTVGGFMTGLYGAAAKPKKKDQIAKSNS